MTTLESPAGTAAVQFIVPDAVPAPLEVLQRTESTPTLSDAVPVTFRESAEVEEMVPEGDAMRSDGGTVSGTGVPVPGGVIVPRSQSCAGCGGEPGPALVPGLGLSSRPLVVEHLEAEVWAIKREARDGGNAWNFLIGDYRVFVRRKGPHGS